MKLTAMLVATVAMIAASSASPTVAKAAGQFSGGYWSQCIANLANGTQIAIPNVNEANRCYSVAQRCVAGRPWVSTQFHSMPVLTSSNPVELCNLS